MPDYRIIVLDGDVICCYERRALAVVGDGEATIVELVGQRQDALVAAGRPERIRVNDVRVLRNVAAAGYDLDTVLPAGLRLELLEVSNLSAGGDAVDYTGHIHPRWAELSSAVVADFGLHLCGVDLACPRHHRAGRRLLDPRAQRLAGPRQLHRPGRGPGGDRPGPLPPGVRPTRLVGARRRSPWRGRRRGGRARTAAGRRRARRRRARRRTAPPTSGTS